MGFFGKNKERSVYDDAEDITRNLAKNNEYVDLRGDLNILLELIERVKINEEENLSDVRNFLRELSKKSSHLLNDIQFQRLVAIFN